MADPGEGPGGPGGPGPPLSQGLDDRPPPPSLSEGVDPTLWTPT